MTRKKMRWANKWNNRMQEIKVTRKGNNSSSKSLNSNKKRALRGERSNIFNSNALMMEMMNKIKITFIGHSIVKESCRITKMTNKKTISEQQYILCSVLS